MLITYTWIDRAGNTPACYRKDISNTTALTTFDYFYNWLCRPRETSIKKSLPMWSPALYKSRKLKESCLAVTHLVYDIDDGTPLEALYEFSEYKYIAHTSYSHSPKKPKWRLILPLSKFIAPDHWQYAWLTGAALWRDKIGSDPDPVCKNSNRFYFALGYPKERAKFAKSAIKKEGKKMELKYELPKKKKKLIIFNQEERIKHERSKGLSRSERITLAQNLGGTILSDRAVKIPCPKCGRKSLWYWLDPTTMKTARCNHKNSCGFFIYPSQLK